MKNSPVVCTLTTTNINYGMIPVGKPMASSVGLPFDENAGSVKINVLFDDGNEKVVLVYDQSHNARFFGVKSWYKANNARPGDQVSIEAIASGELYRLRFIAQQSQALKLPQTQIELPNLPGRNRKAEAE